MCQQLYAPTFWQGLLVVSHTMVGLLTVSVTLVPVLRWSPVGGCLWTESSWSFQHGLLGGIHSSWKAIMPAFTMHS
jgi:hypothetical protein